MYLDHIEGNVDAAARVGNRPDSADAEPAVSRGGPKTGMSNAMEIDDEGEGRKSTKSKKD